MHHAVNDQAPAMLVVTIPENLLPGMASGAILLQHCFFFGRARQVPQDFRAAELRLQRRRGRQIVRVGNPLQHDVVELRSAIDRDRISPIGLEGDGGWNAQGVGAGLHLGEFEFAVGVRVHGGSNAVRRDELDAYALGGISAGDPHHSSGAAREAALHRPFLRLGAIPGVRRRIFAFHAAFSRVKISDQVRDVRIGKTGAKCRHSGAALFDFGGDVVVIYGIAGGQALTLKQVLQ